jgi:hypothetical protein
MFELVGRDQAVPELMTGFMHRDAFRLRAGTGHAQRDPAVKSVGYSMPPVFWPCEAASKIVADRPP